MKSIKLFAPIFLLAALLAPGCQGQWAVFDASNFGEAVQEFGQLQQMYTTAVETRDQIVTAYDLAYQMSRMPQDLAARYQSQASEWTNLSAPDSYGNTGAWVNALNVGGPSQAAMAYQKSVLQAQPFPTSALATQDADTQAVIQNQVATSELGQGVITNALSTVGTIRANSEALSQKLSNLESDTYSTDPSEQSEMAVLGKINTATLLQIRSQQDANQILAAEVAQQALAAKQRMDEQNRLINQSIYFNQNFPSVMQKMTGGISNSLQSISLSPSGH